MRKLITTFCFLLFGLLLYAQTNVTRIEGLVLEAGSSNTPVDFANVALLPSGITTLTNAKGEFVFDKVDAGRTTIKIAFLGKITIDTTVVIQQGVVNRFKFRMRAESFRLEEVTVTATRSMAGQATSTMISRQALDHAQATTIADALQLLPGVRTSNSNLATPDFLSIRGSGGFGTGLLLDGASLNVNTNMMSPVMASYSYNTVDYTRSGIDTRPFSLEDVESIEVIRGIPSVEHGDITSGTVIVKTKTGKTPLNTRISLNPEQYAATIGKGMTIGTKGNVLNLSGDYIYYIKNETESFDAYQRWIGKAGWTKQFGTSTIKTLFELSYQSDDRRSNPYDPYAERIEKASAVGYLFNHNGTLNINKGWLKSIEYVAAARYLDKHEYYNWRLSASTSIYSTALTHEAIVANKPGQRVYDREGNEITRIEGAENAWATYLPDMYYSVFDDYSKEFNGHAKVKVNLFKQWGKVSNGILFGGEYKVGGDFGDGAIYDVHTPPWRPANFRPRAYNDVPFIHQKSAYLEDRLTFTMGRRDLSLTAGVRFDDFSGLNSLLPRLHLSFDLVPQWANLRFSWGRLSKAPAMVLLYPDKDYYDYRITPNVDPSDLIMIQTFVYDRTNPNLKLSIVDAKEAEIDINLGKDGKRYLVLIGYEREMGNNYNFSYSIEDTYKIERQQWQRTSEGFVPNHISAWNRVSKPSNNSYNLQRGIEYILNLGKLEAIRTSFVIDGNLYKTRAKSFGPQFVSGTGANLERHIGIRDESPTESFGTYATTTIRLIHHIPEIGFVITLTPQIQWGNKSWTTYNNDWRTLGVDIIDRYISYVDGNVYAFDPALIKDPEFSYLMPLIAESDTREAVNKRPNALFFNLKVSKAIGQNFTASFSANNVLDSRYRYESTVTPGSIGVLGSNIWFSFELKASF